MATKNLQEVKDKLYQAFDNALSAHSDMMHSGANTHEKVASKAAAISAAARAAEAIATVEHELAVQKAYEDWKASGGRIDDEIAGGIVRDVKTMASLKIKPQGP